MKVVTYRRDGAERLGFLVDEAVIDARAAAAGLDATQRAWFTDTLAVIRAGAPALDLARRLVREAPPAARLGRASVTLAPPMRPSTILCSGSNYRAHNAEKANTPISGKEPEFFVMTADCVIGPDEPIVYNPQLSQKLDCETELAIIIGKPGRHIPVERALEHVFGYTIVNDVSARDLQVRRSPQGLTWYEVGRGKAFETSAPLGPCIVTADEIPDPQTLQLKTRINGEPRQSSSTADMIWSCAELIHFFSISFNLRPGFCIITGTPAGTAWSTDKELGGTWQGLPGLVPATRYCLPGDVVESELETIGVLRNPIVHV